MLISCSTNQTSQNTPLDCQITVAKFTQANMTLALWNGKSLTWNNLIRRIFVFINNTLYIGNIELDKKYIYL